jgi:hypothetical protein
MPARQFDEGLPAGSVNSRIKNIKRRYTSTGKFSGEAMVPPQRVNEYWGLDSPEGFFAPGINHFYEVLSWKSSPSWIRSPIRKASNR